MSVMPPRSRTTRRDASAGEARATRRAIVVERHAELERHRRRGQHVRQIAAAEQRRRRSSARRPASSTRARMPSMPRSSTSRGTHVAPSAIAEGHHPAGETRRRAHHARIVGVGRPARSPASARSRISALASAIASAEAKKPRCASPTFVHTRTSGSAIATSVLISPA